MPPYLYDSLSLSIFIPVSSCQWALLNQYSHSSQHHLASPGLAEQGLAGQDLADQGLAEQCWPNRVWPNRVWPSSLAEQGLAEHVWPNTVGRTGLGRKGSHAWAHVAPGPYGPGRILAWAHVGLGCAELANFEQSVQLLTKLYFWVLRYIWKAPKHEFRVTGGGNN